MGPGSFIEVEENVHSKFINAKLTMQNDHCKIGVSGSKSRCPTS
jgi:tRNA(Ile)-lysidine synthase TilS/MesJ